MVTSAWGCRRERSSPKTVYVKEHAVTEQVAVVFRRPKHHVAAVTAKEPEVVAQYEPTRVGSLGAYLHRALNLQWDTLTTILEKYSGSKIIECLKRHYQSYLRGLTALVEWINDKYGTAYGEPELGVALDPETGNPLFIVITIPGCTRNEWDNIVREIKTEMAKHGLRELRRRVAIVCHQGLVEDAA